ncbi:transporter, SSS family [Prevotella disiens JCM 6334 = ATCC 29426]|uniref:Sodium:solute symporter n=3 Tax=Prevotella disiens TaxID=28130 RepID=A0A096AV71_9BACT|nr:sodium:solute symporter [Prevotella disiens]ERJ78701.1 transporter, SSS family [Prevotella disiens JCM 6334 = ATCC 29426]KGF50636.1 sodium:solute symporter [Prevotella disiens DNF00882]SUB85342.1 Na(+)/glucose symporter [Prevotella disiens]
MIILGTILIYFSLLLFISKMTASSSNNESFFRANKQSPWYLVAFGMIGASISGVTFVSVPGMVIDQNMAYAQTCIGFIFGYILVAFVLLPIYYRLNLITIYTYLKQRLGIRSYKTGASFFLLSKLTGSAVKFYVVCMILQRFVLTDFNIPFPITVVSMVLLIWLYTYKGGIRTLVFTDTFQTICMFLALLLIIYNVMTALDFSISETFNRIISDSHSTIFVWDDWFSKQNFWKQFLSGVFIVVVMTGLDQDMMQKNLTCKTLRDAQKDMCTYGFAFLPVNLLFMSLGILLMMYLSKMNVPLPASPDELMLLPVAGGMLGSGVEVLFTIGVVAACFSTADSALTSLTTSFCVDICEQPKNETLRKRIHFAMSVVFILFILVFKVFNSTSLIDAVYILCSYTYGPLLGLFAFSLLTRRSVNDKFVPYIAIASPLLCFAIDTLSMKLWNYKFGYELLMLNGILTFAGLYLSNIKRK